MMLGDVPMGTRFLFIDPSWLACERQVASRVDILEYNLMNAFNNFTSFGARSIENAAYQSITLPEQLRVASDEVHTTAKGTERKVPDMWGSKHTCTTFAQNIAQICIQVASNNVGDFVLLSCNVSKRA